MRKSSLGGSPHKIGLGGDRTGGSSVCAKRCGRAQTGGAARAADRKGQRCGRSGDSSAPGVTARQSAKCAAKKPVGHLSGSQRLWKRRRVASGGEESEKLPRVAVLNLVTGTMLLPWDGSCVR